MKKNRGQREEEGGRNKESKSDDAVKGLKHLVKLVKNKEVKLYFTSSRTPRNGDIETFKQNLNVFI